MTVPVRMSRKASADIAVHYAYLAERSVPAAERWQTALLRAIDSLRYLPERCPEAPEAEWYGPGMRETYYGKRRGMYRIVFEIHEGVVVILRVRHGRQDLLRPGEA